MEGPSLIILREELTPFLGKKILKVSGNTKEAKESLKGRTLSKVETWAKVLFLTFSDPHKKKKPIVTKTHFLMFGSYRINDPKENRVPRLELKFKEGILYFYTCSIKFDAEEYLAGVDRQVDVMSPDWSEQQVLEKMKLKKNAFLCDLFIDQGVFAGSGNIVKNEVLFNLRRNPLTQLSKIPKRDWSKLAFAVRDYCFNFYSWKKKYELRKHWQVYRKNYCPLCGLKLAKEKTGKLQRKTFYCTRCQRMSLGSKKLKVFDVLSIAGKSGPEKKFDH